MKLGADLFCGAGGTSTGLLQACESLGQKVSLLAINHWNVAIDTHTQNHPSVRHLCEQLDSVDPRKLFPGGKLDILCASPECTHHSNARGGKPRSDQSRAAAWHIVRWAEALRIESILIENVREFRNWGPLNRDGKPSKRFKGKTYVAFLNALRSLGYEVEDRILNAADFGDATTRQRLFIMARRGKKIAWPTPSHAGQWKAARSIIDWTIEGKSIFSRKKSLSENTLRRIAAGLRKFGGEKFILQFDQTGGFGSYVRDVDQPIGTLVTKQNMALVEPFLVTLNHGGGEDCRTHSVKSPVPTLTCRGNLGLVQPFLVHLRGTAPDQLLNSARSLDDPCPTLTTSGAHLALCEPFVIGQQSCAAPRSVNDPIPTVATSGAIALVEPIIVKYYGTGVSRPVSEPLDTVTTRDRFGLVEGQVDGTHLDIRFRMLQPHELSAAMGFPADYKFAGSRESKVKQIGNAVPVRMAAALCRKLLS